MLYRVSIALSAALSIALSVALTAALFIGFAVVIGAGFAGFNSLTCFASENKKVPATGATRRTLVFPAPFSLGSLVLVPNTANGPDTDIQTSSIGQAKGTVVFDLPKSMALALVMSNQALANPQVLASLNGAGIDALKVSFFGEDESERKYCDSALQYLPRFKDLQTLSVDHSDSGDAGLSKIGLLKNLRTISGFMCRVRGDCFKDLRTLPLLSRVDFEHCAIREENLRYLAEIPNLRTLSLGHIELTDKGLGYVCKCQSLTSLRIQDNTSISEPGLKQVLALKHLNNLDLRKTAATMNSIAQLKSMPLKTLWLSDKFLTPTYKARIQVMFPHTELCSMRKSADIKDDEFVFGKLH